MIPTRDGFRTYCAEITGWQQQEAAHTCMKSDPFVVILSTRLPHSNISRKRDLYKRNQKRGFDLDTSVYLCSSEAVDKPPPAVHTSPAAKTFSKSAAAPRNSGINPGTAFKSPTAPDQRSVHLGGPTGNGTRTETLVCYQCDLQYGQSACRRQY